MPVGGDEVVRRSYVGIAYTTIITLGYLVAYIEAVINRVSFVLSRETSMSIVADFSGLSVEYLVVVSAWLCVALRQNKVKSILKTLREIHESSREIGMAQDFEKIVKNLEIQTLYVNVIWFTLFCCDHVLISSNNAFKLAVWLPFNLPRIVTSNVLIIFVNAMLVVKRLFRLLNENIYDLSKEAASRSRVIVRRNRRGSKNRW